MLWGCPEVSLNLQLQMFETPRIWHDSYKWAEAAVMISLPHQLAYPSDTQGLRVEKGVSSVRLQRLR